MTYRQRTQVFIDESNLMGAARLMGRYIDWIRLRHFLATTGRNRELTEILVYVGLPPNTVEWSEVRRRKEKFIAWLKYNRFIPITKDGTPTEGGRSFKSNSDVLMAADVMEWGLQSKPEVVILVTGDADFAYIANKLRRHGIRVEVAAIGDMLSQELRVSANEVIDLTYYMESLELGPRRLV